MRGSAHEQLFAMVVRMSDNSVDPSGNTEAFRAFQTAPAEQAAAPTPSKTPIIAAGVVVAVVLIALIVWLAS
ncbi:hypothetical protein GCM10010172_22680 [Paractinoplanes ferrugineus]|uniref:Uncharacterized protein n=2 Tax=Paractinoplanes ferrugineus TaxID=113564 RepID=A0A919M6X9_9ACTN|nr:hypothetical protein Afe05nite_06610 [Actinoplanes ferrugineus]